MLMSQEASSSGVAGRPRLGVSANAALPMIASANAAATTSGLGVHMLDLPKVGHPPTAYCVEMIDRPAAAPGHQFAARRLFVPGLIGGAALQDGWPTVPAPRNCDPRERHRQHRRLQRRRRPSLAAVRRDLDLGDASVSRSEEHTSELQSHSFISY